MSLGHMRSALNTHTIERKPAADTFSQARKTVLSKVAVRPAPPFPVLWRDANAQTEMTRERLQASITAAVACLS